MVASKETVVVRGNGAHAAPEGFAPLVGEELAKLKEVALVVQIATADVRTAEARVREHENGLEAAGRALDQERAKVAQLMKEKATVELELGIKKSDDLKIVGGLYFRRINGEAKPAATRLEALPPAGEKKE